MASLHGCDSSRHDEDCVSETQISIADDGAITCVIPHLEWRARLEAIRFGEVISDLSGGPCLRHPVHAPNPAAARATLSHELLAIEATSGRSAQ